MTLYQYTKVYIVSFREVYGVIPLNHSILHKYLGKV